jgi:hypothetical protein
MRETIIIDIIPSSCSTLSAKRSRAIYGDVFPILRHRLASEGRALLPPTIRILVSPPELHSAGTLIMKTINVSLPLLAVLAFGLAPSAMAFEGRITATVTRGGQSSGLLYLVGTNQLRIEKTDTNWPHARNIVDLQTGALTLLFPHNRSFVRLKPAASGVSPANPGGFPAAGPRAE